MEWFFPLPLPVVALPAIPEKRHNRADSDRNNQSQEKVPTFEFLLVGEFSCSVYVGGRKPRNREVCPA